MPEEIKELNVNQSNANISGVGAAGVKFIDTEIENLNIFTPFYFTILKYNDISHYFLYLFATFVKMSLAGIILIFCIYMVVIMFQIQVPTTLEYRFITMMSFLLSFGIFLCLSEFAFRKIRNRHKSKEEI
jgi:ABC-type multidrug transport system permease subunit